MAVTDISTGPAIDDAAEGGSGAEAGNGGRKRRKRLIFLGLAALLALCGGGSAAYLLLVVPDGRAGEAVTEAAPEPAPIVPAYVDFEPLFVPYRSAGGYRYRIALVMALEVDRAKGDDRKVRRQIPRLREAYLRSLTERPLPGTQDGTIETVYLKNRIRAENLRILGPGVVNDVLIRDIRVVPG